MSNKKTKKPSKNKNIKKEYSVFSENQLDLLKKLKLEIEETEKLKKSN